MTDEVKPLAELSFRESMEELESLVAKLESNELELEESLVSYERGVALLRSLKTRLAAAQQRVDVLMGELSDEQDDALRDSTLS